MWVDYNLIWNVSDFGGIRVVRIPADKVWKSDIILYNKYVSLVHNTLVALHAINFQVFSTLYLRLLNE